jgi:alanine-glyoxylate transaminase / serine-glyoxylate transaminase / serine-pyruvate transaminase
MKIPAPGNIPLDSILPTQPTLLMGSGPVPIPAEVAAANGKVISHLGETMKQIVSRLQLMGQYVFQTNSKKIFGIAGPSSAAMEMAVTSLLYPGRKVLVLNLGTFSARFTELARGVGAEVTELYPDGLNPFRVEEVKKALESQQYHVLTLVQGETSCGIKNIELEGIVKLAKSYGVRTIVDAVCTLSTMALPMDEWGIDIAVVGGQKGLSAIPGISLIAFSEETFEFINKREERMPHWCLDPRRAHKFWSLGEYHYTAPVTGILAIHEGLRLICQETLEKRFERHLFCSTTLQHCLEVMGMEMYAPQEFRLNSVVAIKNRNQTNTKELLAHMVNKYGVEISGAFGLDIIRVGQMGEQCRLENLRRVIEAMGMSYLHLGVKLDVSGALAEFDSIQERHLGLEINSHLNVHQTFI